LYIAFCALSLAIFCELSLSHPDPFNFKPVHLFIFFSTLFTYNYHRLVYLKLAYRLNYLLIMMSFIFTVASFLSFNGPAKHLSMVLGLVCLAYPLKLYQGKSLRSIPYFKTALIAIVWAFAVVILPQLSHGHSAQYLFNNEQILFWFFFVMLFVFAEAFAFDIRDINNDRNTGLITLANSLGLQRSRVLNFLFFLLMAIGTLFSPLPQQWQSPIIWSLLLTLFTGAALAVNINKERSKLYYSVGMESILIMPLIIFILTQLFLT